MEDTQGEVIFEPWAEETIELTSTPGICSNKLKAIQVVTSFRTGQCKMVQTIFEFIYDLTCRRLFY